MLIIKIMGTKIIGIALLGLVLMCSSCGNSGRRHKKEPSTEIVNHSRSTRDAKSSAESSSSSHEEELSASAIFKKCNPAVFMIYTSDGDNVFQGSGFFISENGVAVSNYHVFKGTSVGLEEIKLVSGETLKVGQVILKDEENDFIIFQVAGGNETFAHIDISPVTASVGDVVYALGSPQGLENTFSSGIISQRRSHSILQISTPIDHGSSGGALLNTYGEAVGITAGGRDDSGANLNYAIDMEVVSQAILRFSRKIDR
jgi:serine protease Do